MGCGICGFVGMEDKALLHKMCDTMVHRGPDEQGFFSDKAVGLGITRLSIIDLNTGSQPIHNEDETVWVVLNGEIYNYIELRELLRKSGHRFYTSSDTEVLVHCYEEYGANFMSKLKGMFAFALWDSSKARLILARDRFGKKPLYYAVTGDHLLFASELKSLLQCHGLQRTLNWTAVDLFLVYSYIPYPHTIFHEIRKLLPGNILTWENNVAKVAPYWELNILSDVPQNEQTLSQQLYKLLLEAVRIRLRSDVSLGAFLSGGLDSSTVVSIMAKLSKTPVKTYSVGFEDEAFDELKYAKVVAEYLRTDHRELIVRPESTRILPRIAWHLDEPFADPSAIPTYYVSEACRRDVKVALTGDGGDEVFMGYQRLNSLVAEPSAYGRSALAQKLVETGIRTARGLGVRKLIHGKNTLTRFAASLSSEERRYLNKASIFATHELRELRNETETKHHSSREDVVAVVGELFEKTAETSDRLKAVYYVTAKLYLAEDILTKVDRMSMAHSLEIRCPFLDHELAETMMAAPSKFKASSQEVKLILRSTLARYALLPKEIIGREKHGFGVPLGSWFSSELHDAAECIIQAFVDRTKIFKRSFVERLFAAPRVHSRRLYALMMFSLWYRMYVEEFTGKEPPFDINHYLSR